MEKILQIYLIFGVLAAVTETISFHILFYFKKNYVLAGRYSYILSAFVSFFGNLKYGFRVDITPQLFVIGFSLVLYLNLIILKWAAKIYKSINLKPFYANGCNIFITSICNLLVYSIISKLPFL